jgi:predicted acyltransferase
LTNHSLTPQPAQRLLSLDVLRGITIAFMIMVNNNGGPGSWRFMNHAAWNGLTPTDLVFPTFLFVVGVSVVFAFAARLARGVSRSSLAWHTVQRAVILFLLGVLVNSFPTFELPHMRFYGVLQRIAVCFLVVGLFYLWDRRAWTKAAALVVALAGYWVLLRWVPVPGAGLPGRDIPFMDPSLNLTSWLDRCLLPHHLYLEPPLFNVRDPEGLLSDLPAVGTALIGVLTGLWLRASKPVAIKTLGLAIAAVVSLALGYLWSISFPLNKNLWTSSYVLVAAGYSLALFALVYWAIEQKGWRRGWTWGWMVFGANAITAYLISELLPGALSLIHWNAGGERVNLLGYLFNRLFAQIPNPGWAAFAYSVSYTALCFLPVWVLYRKKIFVKI